MKCWRNADTGVELICLLAGALIAGIHQRPRFMSLLSLHDRALPRLRKSLFALVALASTTSCERFKERILGMEKSPAIGQQPLGFDSLSIRRDSITRRNQAAKDSLDALNAVRFVTDSLTHGKRTPAIATGGTVVAPAQPRSRAQILGDSIANAQIEKIAGQNRVGASGDTVRGVVKMDGSGPGSRPVLLANGGKSTITLTGMGTDGLAQVLGSDVVVRGVRISPRDIVVSGFSVRAVNGIPTIDGRLKKSAAGWSIELSDQSGIRKLAAVPEALQAFEGARVWVAEEVNNGMPQLYGVIARR